MQCVTILDILLQGLRIMKIRFSFSADADSMSGKIATCFIVSVIASAFVLAAYFVS